MSPNLVSYLKVPIGLRVAEDRHSTRSADREKSRRRMDKRSTHMWRSPTGNAGPGDGRSTEYERGTGAQDAPHSLSDPANAVE